MQVTEGSIDGEHNPWSLNKKDGQVKIVHEDSNGNIVDTHYVPIGSTNFGGMALSIGLGAGIFVGGNIFDRQNTGGLYGGLGYTYNFGHAGTLDELNSYLEDQADNMFCVIICNDIDLHINSSLNPSDWDWSGNMGVGIIVPIMTKTNGVSN